GTFRGVRFYSQKRRDSEGRHIAKHDFLLTDNAAIGDMGRKWPSYSIEGFAIDQKGDLLGQQLHEALSKPGYGRLIHPWLGAMWAFCSEFTVSSDVSEAGITRFNMVFIPKPAEDGGLSIANAPNQTQFADDLQNAVLGQPAWADSLANYVDKLQKFNRLLSGLNAGAIMGMVTDYLDKAIPGLKTIQDAIGVTAACVTNKVCAVREPFVGRSH
ncbi:MAG: DNA circularization N-terminal domain-containing protein, partial [Alphaproteobacteria bacterium]|nr:DNA circularization N-terminal domain-containing protein [Alphaproteobacteria bacterium]